MKTKKIPTFTINRRLWHRGKRKHESALLVAATGRMCCLGQIALQCGYTKDEIRDKAAPSCLEDDSKLAKFDLGENYHLADEMMPVNDDTDLDDTERERELKRLAKGHFKLRFVK